MSFGSILKSLGKQVTPKSLSIKGHKFSLNPATAVLQGVVSNTLQGKNAGDVWRGIDEDRKASWRTGAAGAAAYGGATALGALGGAGAGGGAGIAGGGGLSGVASAINPGDLGTHGIGNVGMDATKAAATTDPSRFRSVMGFLSKHKNDILDYGREADYIAQQHRRNKMQDELLARARADDPRRQALRTAGTNLLMDDSRPDLSGVFNDPNDPGNPANRYRRVNVGSRAV